MRTSRGLLISCIAHQPNFFSRISDFYEYNSTRSTEEGVVPCSIKVMYSCPFTGQCACPVKFRVATTQTDVFLYTHDKHTAGSHFMDNSVRGSIFKLSQKEAALLSRPAPPMFAEALILWRIGGGTMFTISPSKQRGVSSQSAH